MANKNKKTNNRKKNSETAPPVSQEQENCETTEKNNTSNDDGNNTNTQRNNKPKRVNRFSTNRRQKKRNNLDRDATPERSNRNVKVFNHKSRVCLKLTLPSSTNVVHTIHNTLKEYLNALGVSDNDAEILPWYGRHAMKENLSAGNRVPKELSALKIYLNKFYIPKEAEKGCTIYPKIYIGHNKQLKDIFYDLEEWKEEGNNGIYRNMVQAENVEDVGWLLWSTREFDAGALADEMNEIFGFEVGLRWKNINQGIRNIPDEKQVKALIVELDSTKKREQAKEIAQFYNRRNTNSDTLPNGVRMRFVKSIRDCINRVDEAKIAKLRGKQKRFTETVCNTYCFDIEQIDYAGQNNDDDESYTLRQMIMNLKHSTKNVPLFINVDLDWKEEGHVFQYAPEFRQEAETTISTLIPIMRHLYPEQDTDEFFTDEARERCLGLAVNPNTGLVEDADAELYDIEDDDMAGFTFNFDPSAAAELMRPRVAMPYDEDDVSTLRSHHTPKRRRRINMIDITDEENSVPSQNSNQSNSSSITAQTIKTLENDMAILRTEMLQQAQENQKRIDDKLDKLMSLFPQSDRLRQAPDVEMAGSEVTQAGSGL